MGKLSVLPFQCFIRTKSVRLWGNVGKHYEPPLTILCVLFSFGGYEPQDEASNSSIASSLKPTSVRPSSSFVPGLAGGAFKSDQLNSFCVVLFRKAKISNYRVESPPYYADLVLRSEVPGLGSEHLSKCRIALSSPRPGT